MAVRTITLTVSSPTEGVGWNVSFSADDATSIKTIVNFAINCPTNNYGNFSVPNTGIISNVVNGFSSHYGGGTPTSPAGVIDDSYVTWRSNTATTGQYPSSGKSLDIWGYEFYNDIMYNSFTWGQMSATYALNPRKWSLIYDYTATTAFIWSKGGTLNISVV